MKIIYLDYNATTPVDPHVAAAMIPYMEEYYGNPSSSHVYGIEPKTAIIRARGQVAELLRARTDEIVFTSGGTESNNFAIKGVAFASRGKGNHIITSAIEHPAVTEVCRNLERFGFEITWLPVDETGLVEPGDVLHAITPRTILISVMHANNETGTIQPIGAIGRIAREHGILFHTDAAQSAGKIIIDIEELGVDLLSIAGHKLYAPKGIGALYIRRGVKLEKLIHGADHESNLRAGTENVMQIAGLGQAAEIAHNIRLLSDMRDRLHQGILKAVPEVRLNGHPELRLPNTLSLGFPGVEAGRMLEEMKGVAASAGAACHADQVDISAVLEAMHVPLKYAMGTVRFSTGRGTTVGEIDAAIPIIVNAYHQAKGGGNHQGAMMEEKVYHQVPRSIQVPLAGWQDGIPGKQDTNSLAQNSKLEIKNEVAGIRLTEYTHALGCACKIRPQMLERILKGLPVKQDPDVLVGIETSDDAAVFRISDDRAIVQTVDFIPPVVDDPYMYGAISAANALSDIYAMGGKPLFALSIVGFPDKKLPEEVLQLILRGAGDKVAEAGIQVIGGHSIEDEEPKFGLAVTGLIDPRKILRNSTARPGDALVLTKPLGTGIITTAIKRGIAAETAIAQVMQMMATLNRVAAEIMEGFDVNACTDVTGFGLLGHLKEMVRGAGVLAVISAGKVPLMTSVWDYAMAGAIPGGSKNNLDFVKDTVSWDETVPDLLKLILADAQTSGGLLISLPAIQAQELVVRLGAAGNSHAAIIGRIDTGDPAIIVSTS